MKGRKPNLGNVVPLREDGEVRPLDDRAAESAAALKWDFFNQSQGALWDEIAPELFKLGRLKGHFVHAAMEYVIVLDQLRTYRAFLFLEGETYEVKGRNGTQIKSRPEVGQRNQAWSQWRALSNDLGLTPAAERGLSTQIGDLFEDPASEFM